MAVIRQVVRDLNLHLAIRVVPDGPRRRRPGAVVAQRAAVGGRARAARWPFPARCAPASRRTRGAAIRRRRRARALDGLDVEYAEVATFDGQPTLVVAARAGATRLIDNVPLDRPELAGLVRRSSDGHEAEPTIHGRLITLDTSDRRSADAARSLPRHRAQRGERIVMVTAYDAPSARLADGAGVDIVLVGDSAGTTVARRRLDSAGDDGRDARLHARASRAARGRALVVADMPFGSYQVSEERRSRARSAS